MKNTYIDLIQQTYDFPQAGFDLQDQQLTFHGVSLQRLIEKYGTPFKLTYLPKIGTQIKQAQQWFAEAMQKRNYQGAYYFCYCTKCNHFHHVINEALRQDVHLETSSAFDIDLVEQLYKKKKIDKSIRLLHNGYKTNDYLQKVRRLMQEGYCNSVLILDSQRELQRIEALVQPDEAPVKIGLRLAVNQDVKATYFTSRLGIPRQDALNFIEERVIGNPKVELTMLHFFVDSGIQDSLYYWKEFQRAIELYAKLKKQLPSLTGFNIGGGFPVRNHLGFEYDYQYMVEAIVAAVQDGCAREGVPTPDLFTEFGKYTVGEAGAIVFEVLEQKRQNDMEHWYIINNSLMNTIPDAWSIHEKFILLPINKWENPYQRVIIGGISCDQADYYNSEDFNQEILLPSYKNSDKEPLYLGFFHTGAYQDAISGYGGIKHCLIPSPQHIIVERDEAGNFVDYLYRDEQTAADMFKILGYT
jgi:arginine decarboxylase